MGAFTKGQLISGVLREIGAALCRFNAHLEQAVSGFFAKASRQCLRHSRRHLTADVEDSEQLFDTVIPG
jgi:hypothetical protein